jgi:protein gp37
MGKNSTIGWTHHTMNFWWGCTKVSRECKHCYIGPIMKHGGKEPFQGPIRTSESTWRQPYCWERNCRNRGVRERVFTCSMSDFFHEGAEEWRPEAWQVIKNCQSLDWLILTKRPELVMERLPPDWGEGYPNVWLGVSCGRNDFLPRLDILHTIPAALRFVSAEPLLGPIDFRLYLGWLDWVITGCERAAKGQRQVMETAWVRDIDQQCRDHGALHFFKQAYAGEQGVPCETPLLDGKVVQQFPVSAATRRFPNG